MGVYATLTNVKEILLSTPNLRSGGKKVDFSEAYRDLRSDPNNVGSIQLNRVDFDDGYFGSAKFLITFTSASAFDAIINPEGNVSAVSLGSGDTSSLFTATNPMITPSTTVYTIDPSYWGGVASVGDKVVFLSTSAISNTIAENVINQASFFIDGMILGSKLVTSTTPQSLIYTALTLPSVVGIATSYLAAYLIWARVHRGDDLAKSFVRVWKEQAVAYAQNYIRQLPRPGPAWRSRQPLIATSKDDKIRTNMFEGDFSGQSAIDATLEEVVRRMRTYENSQDHTASVFP